MIEIQGSIIYILLCVRGAKKGGRGVENVGRGKVDNWMGWGVGVENGEGEGERKVDKWMYVGL